jgi:hypothetical protein
VTGRHAVRGLPAARATQIPDGKMENPFLKTFGRPPASWPASASARATRTSPRRSSSSAARPSTTSSGPTGAGWPARRERSRRRADHARALSRRPRREPNDSERSAAATTSPGHRSPPGRRGPGLGPDQLQRVPLPTLTRGRSLTRPAPPAPLASGDLRRRGCLQPGLGPLVGARPAVVLPGHRAGAVEPPFDLRLLGDGGRPLRDPLFRGRPGPGAGLAAGRGRPHGQGAGAARPCAS